MLQIIGKTRVFKNKGGNGTEYLSTQVGSKQIDGSYINKSVFIRFDKECKLPTFIKEGDMIYADIDIVSSAVSFTMNEEKNIVTLNAHIFEVK